MILLPDEQFRAAGKYQFKKKDLIKSEVVSEVSYIVG